MLQFNLLVHWIRWVSCVIQSSVLYFKGAKEEGNWDRLTYVCDFWVSPTLWWVIWLLISLMQFLYLKIFLLFGHYVNMFDQNSPPYLVIIFLLSIFIFHMAGWIDCPPIGHEIGYLIPSKVPLGESFNDCIVPGKRYSFRQVIRNQRISGKMVSNFIAIFCYLHCYC